MTDEHHQARIAQARKDAEHAQSQTALIMQLAQASFGVPGPYHHTVVRMLETIVRANNWVIGQYWTISEEEDLVHCSEWFFSLAHLPDFRHASLDRQLSKGVDLPGRVWSTGFPIVVPELKTESGMQFTRLAASVKSALVSGMAFAIKKTALFSTGVFEFFDVNPIVLTQQDTLFYEKVGLYISTLIGQKQTEATARQVEEEYKIVLQHAYDAFVAINEASLITQWTPRAAALFGWEASEVLGKPLVDIIIPERFRDAHMKGIFRYMTTKEEPPY